MKLSLSPMRPLKFLFAVLMAITESGAEVLVGDLMYATYEGLIAATGAVAVPVPLRWRRCLLLPPALRQRGNSMCS